jgi:hypothetical protein
MLDSEIKLKLGDIIQVKSPTNAKFHLKYFLIEYINDETIKLTDIMDGERKTLELYEHKLIDKTITEILLLSRSDENGFAKQHNLLPNTDVKMDFDGEIIVGKVTNLEEDMIEVKTTDDKTIYLDFEYKGAPESLKEISVIDDLTVQKSLELTATKEEEKEEKEKEKEEEEEEKNKSEEATASMKFSEQGNAIIEMPEDPTIDNQPILDLTQFVPPIDEDREEVKSPTQDLVETLLKRNSTTITHNIVSRFKELRSQFAIFDKNGNILGPRMINESYKPLVERLDSLDTNIRWIIPVTNDLCSHVYYHTVKSGVAKTDLTTFCHYKFQRQIEGETVTIRTVIMMPNMELSRIDLPNTNILTKTALSREWKYTRLTDEDIVLNRVDNVNEEFKYEDDSFKKPMTFDISPSIKAEYKSVLQSIIPGGVSLINEDHIGYSLDQMLAFYEPFLIYRDTVSAKSEFYKEIRKRIHDNIKTYLEDYNKGKREMLLDTESLDLTTSILLDNVKTELLNRIKKEYRLQEKQSTSELLNRINAFDNGRFYMSVMSYLMAYLYTPELADIVMNDDSDINTKSKSCLKRVIAKKYTSIEALQKDNGRGEVYFDKEYDATPYEILKKHAEAQKNMNNDEFVDYLTVVLKNEHKVEDDDLAESLAKTIIMKKKPVEDGNYAMLVIYPKLKTPIDELSTEEKDSVEIEADVKKRVSYFMRKHDNWITVAETDVDLCNEEDTCLFDKNSEFCNFMENANDRIKKIAKKNLRHEIETTIQLTMKDFEEGLAKIFQSNEKNLSKIQKLQKYKDELYAVRAYKMGAKVAEQETVTSPFEKMRDAILSCPDFTKRQEYIVNFKNTYCREAVINGVLNESIHWYYCKKTNLKLLPAFLFKLAQSHDYEKHIEEIIASNGVEVDGAILDKHSGYLIQPILKNGDKVDKQEEKESAKDVCFVVPTRGTDQFVVYTVAKALCNRLDVEFQDKIIAHTLRLIVEDIMEVKYYSNKLNHKTPFHVWKMRNIILFTAAVTFVVIQTHISPTGQIDKKCLEGFPLEESENYSGLHCMISILNDLKNGLGEPWVNIKKHTPEKILKELSLVIKKHLLPDFKISQMLEGKRAIQAIVSKHVHKKRWLLFQPPQDNVEKIKNLAISPSLVSEINESIKTANKTQHDYLGTMYTKIIENTYSYIQERNDPCLDFVKQYGQVYNEIQQLAVPPVLLSKTLKTIVLETDAKTFSENNIYSAYMHYCNLQNDLPIPDDLITICQEKVLGLETMGLEQAINVLEDSGKKQTSITLSQLLSTVARRNIVHVHEDEQPLAFTDIEPSDNQDLVVSHILNALLNKESVDDLESYLKHLNQKMLENIKEYLNIYGRDISREMKTKVAKHLENIHATKNIGTFIKNSIYHVTASIPAKMRHASDDRNQHVCLLFEEISKDAIIKDIVFLVSQLATITQLKVEIVNNIYKYCYLSLFSQMISESKDDKYVKYKIENLFDGNEVDFVDDRHNFYNDISSVIRDIVERDMRDIEFMSQVYVAPVVTRCEPKKNAFDFDFDVELD